MQFRLLNLGPIPPLDTQVIFHAVGKGVDAGESPATLVICWPRTDRPGDPPGLVSVGFHQDLAREVDLEYCSREGIPVARRILGGGAVYLDSGQVFYQVVAPRGALPATTREIFEHLLRAPVRTYRWLGIDAEYAPVNDVRTKDGRKVSGNGLGFVGDAVVVSGNLIETFDFERMGRVLRVPDEKFRDKAVKAMRQYLGTIHDLIEGAPPRKEVVEHLVGEFEEVLGGRLVPGELTREERAEMARLREKYRTDDWLFQRDAHPLSPAPGRTLKVTGDVRLHAAAFKSPGGLIRASLLERDGRVEEADLSGDFHLTPREALHELRKRLRGQPADPEALTRVVENFFAESGVDSPGTGAKDFAKALSAALASK
ncbi:MAG: lipoate protein ligase C-terminal domain-containing protein [Promethearchaeota archaeon]